MQSPVAGGILNSAAKHIAERLPSSPPCSSSTMSSEGMASKLKNLTDGGHSTSILKPSPSSVQHLASYENLCANINTKISSRLVEKEICKALDPDFMPVSLAKGRDHLFVSSQQTNQVQVFRGKSHQGVLKKNNSKYFASLHAVHFIEMSKATDDKLVVLDNEGFHLFNEQGMHLYTILETEGYKYRGLGHIYLQGKLCLVTLDVNEKGVKVNLMDLTEGSPTFKTFVKR